MGFLNAKKRPLKEIEIISIFNSKIYKPQNLKKNLKGKNRIGKNTDVLGKYNAINKSEFTNVNDLEFSLEKNGNVVQQSTTALMLWKIDALIAYISKFFTLKIGDIIFTGTPSGVGKVVENDQLVGRIQNKEMFSITVK